MSTPQEIANEIHEKYDFESPFPVDAISKAIQTERDKNDRLVKDNSDVRKDRKFMVDGLNKEIEAVKQEEFATRQENEVLREQNASLCESDNELRSALREADDALEQITHAVFTHNARKWAREARAKLKPLI